ncbi:MAG TPA: wax ester/triacylglycerol synthase family O-acyltransferase [Solirubrobacteraceae bacterium]|nr:wax ester/triacylglycerol synthase family O-acyltransferase [Solirubrobacteraceae bacterium]
MHERGAMDSKSQTADEPTAVALRVSTAVAGALLPMMAVGRRRTLAAMADPLTSLDATFLELEQLDEGATMHIGAVMVFDPLPDGTTPTLEAVCRDVASRLTLLPRYSERLSSERTGRLTWPRWQEDPQFDVRNHVHRAALPAPGGEAELCEWAADYFSHRLDRTRPLWEMVLLEGLEQDRWALVTKTHHALVDGVGSVDVVHLLLDPQPPARLAEARPAEDRPGSVWEARLPHPPDAVADLARAGARAAAAGVHAARHPREALERSRSLAELIVRDELIGAPHTSINVPIGATRRFQVVRASLSELKAIRRELGGSVNDVVLAACTAGLRRLLLSRGESPPVEGLRAMVPMNVRDASEELTLGNRVSSLFVELPVAEPDPLRRLRKIVEHTCRLKASGAALGAATMIDIAALAPPLVHAPIARSLYATRLFNVTITNVPGPRTPLYAFGAALREIHPVVPLAARHAVGIAIFSYNGGVVLGLSADCDSTPDLDVLREGVEEGFAELRVLLSSREPRPSARGNGARPKSPLRAAAAPKPAARARP